ncbi:MAG: ABC transporter ATP-binding protein [Bacteroidia bacterium]
MIKAEDIGKRFGGEIVLNKISFSLSPGTTLSILGKSGCGKTTLLKILAGLLASDEGTFTVNGQNMFALPPQQRGVVYLSQEPLLFPHMNVFDNLAYGLKIRKLEKSTIRAQVTQLASKLELEDHLSKSPEQLSGGQKQRVSFGRALIINPQIMLLDEPFGSLDTQTRVEMQKLFRYVSQSVKMTALFVTHDLKEALTMGDQIALMHRGSLKQYDSVQTLAQDPESGIKAEIDFWKNLL